VPPERRFVSKRLQESNWLQALEGGIDSSHVSFLHGAALKHDPLFVGSKGNEYNERDRMPQFDVVDFAGGLLIGARRNAESGRYYWRITPWVLPTHTTIPPRAGHPLGAHVWVPIDDENCWAWSINYHPGRALASKELEAMRSGRGIHVSYIPGTFIPLQNKRNDYMIDREGHYYIDNNEVLNPSLESLSEAIERVAGDDRDRPVTLRADAMTPHQSVVTAMDALGRLGFTRLSIATTPTQATTHP